MKKKLLLADDSITIQKVIQITFSHDDYILTVVDNGDAALEKARAERPDLVLADVFMPGRNGYELCAAIKQDPSLAGTPVLLLTGTFEPFDEAKAKSAGADKWIAKPFESQSLINCVEEILANTRSSKPAAAAQATSIQATPTSAPPLSQAPAPSISTAAPSLSTSPLSMDSQTIVAAPAVAPIASTAPNEPDVAVDDMWGDEFLSEPVSPLESVSLETMPASDDNDLWGDDSFAVASPVAIEPAASDDDLWGSFEDTDAISTESLTTPASIVQTNVDQDMWGDVDGLASSFDDQTVLLATEQPQPLAELDLEQIGDAEILEEIELSDSLVTPDAASLPTAISTNAEEQSFADLTAVSSTPPAATAAYVPPATPSLISRPAVNEPAPPSAVEPASEPVVIGQVQGLDEAALERVVEKVAGVVIERLANTLLEKIAWEVVPDLAEVMIKEELRKIREEASAL